MGRACTDSTVIGAAAVARKHRIWMIASLPLLLVAIAVLGGVYPANPRLLLAPQVEPRSYRSTLTSDLHCWSRGSLEHLQGWCSCKLGSRMLAHTWAPCTGKEQLAFYKSTDNWGPRIVFDTWAAVQRIDCGTAVGHISLGIWDILPFHSSRADIPRCTQALGMLSHI